MEDNITAPSRTRHALLLSGRGMNAIIMEMFTNSRCVHGRATHAPMFDRARFYGGNAIVAAACRWQGLALPTNDWPPGNSHRLFFYEGAIVEGAFTKP
jgi:TPP-dependent pyruvate/acetoin dehydrogenase alpha subunit